MSTEDKKIFAYLQEDYTVEIACPVCEQVSSFDLSREQRGTVELEVACPCGNTCTVEVNMRRFPRKEVRLPGTFSMGADGEKESIIVTNLSRGGLRFEVARWSRIAPGTEIVVEIVLEDYNNTVLRKEAVIRSVQGSLIGAEFLPVDPDSEYEKVVDMTLKFYIFWLKPQKGNPWRFELHPYHPEKPNDS